MASIRKRRFGPNKDREAWVVDYADQHGQRRLKTFSTKKDAVAWRTNALHEVQLGSQHEQDRRGNLAAMDGR
jgi:integrase